MNQDSTIGAQSTSVSVATPPGERVRARLVNRKTEILLPVWIIGKTINIGLMPVWLTGALGLFARQRCFRHAHRDQGSEAATILYSSDAIAAPISGATMNSQS